VVLKLWNKAYAKGVLSLQLREQLPILTKFPFNLQRLKQPLRTNMQCKNRQFLKNVLFFAAYFSKQKVKEYIQNNKSYFCLKFVL
jgi:hypothetical protein